MTTRIVHLGTLLVLLSGCNALKLVAGDRAGLPCNTEQGCGAGYACVDGACVEDTRDGGSDAARQDAAGQDTATADTSAVDTTLADSATLPPWDLTLTGSGFLGMTGNMASAVVVNAAGELQSAVQSTGIANGSFVFTWAEVLSPSVAYSVHVFFDPGGDGVCDATEPQFDVAVGTVTGDRVVSMLPSQPQAVVCQSFDVVATDAGGDGGAGLDLTIQGSGFASYMGQVLHLELFSEGATTAAASTTHGVSTANFTKTMVGVLDGAQEYTLSWWFETGGPGACGQDSLGGQVYIGAPDTSVTVPLDGTSAVPGGCLDPCDLDHDGAQGAACSGGDCDDTDLQRFPGNPEICGDDIDQDCSGADALCDGGGLDGGPEWLDLHLIISGFAASAPYELLIYNTTDPGAPEGTRITGTLDADGNDEINTPDIFVGGHPYTLLLFVHDGDSMCSIPPDSAYVNNLGSVTQDVDLTLLIANCGSADCDTVIQFGMASAPDAGAPGDAGSFDGPDAGACDPDAGESCEKWLLKSSVDGGYEIHLSKRDCQNSQPLCTDCFRAYFSPSGQKILVGRTPDPAWVTNYWLVDLMTDPWTWTDLMLGGGAARWLDETQFVYVVGTGCGATDLYEIRHHGIDPTTDDLLVGGLKAIGGGFVVTPDLAYLAHSEQTSACWSPSAVIRINAPAGMPSLTPAWSENNNVDEPIALLHDGSAFLAQTMTSYSPPSSIHVVTWDGAQTTIYAGIDASVSGFVGAPGCVARQRLGSSGQFYCNASPGDGPVHRLDVAGATPSQVVCEVSGKGVSIEDVWEP